MPARIATASLGFILATSVLANPVALLLTSPERNPAISLDDPYVPMKFTASVVASESLVLAIVPIRTPASVVVVLLSVMK